MRGASRHRDEQPSTKPSSTDNNSIVESQKVLQEGDRANPWVDLVMIQVFWGDSQAQGAELPPPIGKVLSALTSQKLLLQQHSGLGAMTTSKTASKEEQSTLLRV